MNNAGTDADNRIAKVLIVDDHPAVREGLAMRISRQPDLEVCGEAAGMAEALELMRTARPDVLVVDLKLKDSSGFDLIRRVRAKNKRARILVWSAHRDSFCALRALRAGALGYVNKEHATAQVVDAIRAVRDGKLFLCDEMAQQILAEGVQGASPLAASPIESLSDREMDVFQSIGEGLSASETARRLHIRPSTVETHRKRIKQKLNLQSAGDLNRAAVQWTVQGDLP